MTYAGSDPVTPESMQAPRPSSSAVTSSSTTSCAPSEDAASVSPDSVTTSRIPESSTMNLSRGAGDSESSGTYAPPALRTPSTPTAISAERDKNSPTITPGPTP